MISTKTTETRRRYAITQIVKVLGRLDYETDSRDDKDGMTITERTICDILICAKLAKLDYGDEFDTEAHLVERK